MISKEQFKKRIAFLKERQRFLANRKRRKPVTLEEVLVPVPEVNPKDIWKK